MSSISISIITLNEENNIRACLESCKWADEIIIVDSGSTDKTLDIAREYTDKIYSNTYDGCGPQKKWAYDKTTCDWVLILDADERLTLELQKEIQFIINSDTKFSGFEIPFQSFYLGKKIRFGDWIGEKHLRLIKRTKSDITPRLVHFGIAVDGKIGKLKNKILHYSFPRLETVIKKMDNYSTLGAAHKLSQKKSASIFTAILHGLFAFVRGYFFKLGFLDGKYGFMLALSNAEGSYYKYAKLNLLRSQNN